MINGGASDPDRGLRPLAYGYLRLPAAIPEGRLRTIMDAIRARADALGFEFATVFREATSDSVAGWEELITELRRAEARHVIIPSLRDAAHLSARAIMGGPEPDLVLYALDGPVRAVPSPRWKVVHDPWPVDSGRRPAPAVFR